MANEDSAFRRFMLSACRINELVVGLIAMACLLLMLGVVVMQIVSRLFHPVAWTEEASRYLAIWVASTGAARAFRAGEHASIQFLSPVLPAQGKKFALRLICLLILLCFWSALAVWGWIAAMNTRNVTSPVMGIPMFWPKLAIPLGAVSLLVSTIFLIHEGWCHWRAGTFSEQDLGHGLMPD